MSANHTPFIGPNQGRYSRRMADLEAQLRQANRELKLERERSRVLRDMLEAARREVLLRDTER